MRPRIRSLKPEIWHDEKVGALSREARLLFVGLITMADDEGRFLASSRAILGHVFPYDEDVDSQALEVWIDELSASGTCLFYVQNALRYGAFRCWAEHQLVNRPRPSRLPNPPSPRVVRANRVSLNDHGSFIQSSRSNHTPARRRVDPDPDPSSSSLIESQDVTTEDDARALFDYWRERCDHPQARASSDRLRKIRARLAEGYTPEQIRKAIDGAAVGAFVNEQGRRFDDVELICRNGSKLEDFMGRVDPVVRFLRDPALERMDAWKQGYPEEAS